MKKILRFVAPGLVVIGVAGFFGYTYLFGAGTVHLVTDNGRTLELVVDGEVLTPSRSQFGHQRYDVPRGLHTVEVRDPVAQKSKSYSVSIQDGFTELLLPRDEEQCFARIDVTAPLYLSKGGPPVIKQKWTESAPIELPGTNYFHEEETPRTIKEKARVHLVRPIACATASSPDVAILAEMGW